MRGNQPYLLDFGDSGFGFRLFELATTLFKTRDEPGHPALEAALLEGYTSVRPLDTTLLSQFILLRADRDLLWLAQQLGNTEAASQLQRWIDVSIKGSEQLWDADVGAFCARNLRSGDFAGALTNASMLAFYADAGTTSQRDVLAQQARDILAEVRFAFPSWDPRDNRFEAKRYWRGPVWAIMNYMIARGLEECGETELGKRVSSDTLALIASAGYDEYFDPTSGAGLGGNQFTWTAAVQLALAG